MKEKDWYQVDIVTCAAPNLRKRPGNSMNLFAGKNAAEVDDKRLYEIHLKRIERIFKAAAANGAVVAKAFRTVQEKYAGYFETIVYAVYCNGYETENYKAFYKEFHTIL